MTLSLCISEIVPSTMLPISTPLISVMSDLKFDTACRTLATMLEVSGFVLMMRTFKTLPAGKTSARLPFGLSLLLDQLICISSRKPWLPSFSNRDECLEAIIKFYLQSFVCDPEDSGMRHQADSSIFEF